MTKSGEQCCTRYKTVLKRKNVAAVENNISDNSPTEVPYEDELEKIRWLDDSLEPEVVRGRELRGVKIDTPTVTSITVRLPWHV